MKYFAYGSNMLHQRLKRRVPSAKIVSTAKLVGYKLRFHKRGRDGSGKCNAFKTNDPQDKVYGAVFEIGSLEKIVLDESEGLGYGYNEEQVELLSNGNKIEAFMYIADNSAIDESLAPYTWYKEFVVNGAKQNSLPPEYISYLESFAAMKDPDKVREAQNYKILSAIE
ncbi:MAG TPA: gamma-glutamylcyclotransferase family protein [Pyrinomonadaceae bacterium]|jgi:gamma-glutamylcyclotransferase (GGCT)/AIG2-like uncharacterized protein YtfP